MKFTIEDYLKFCKENDLKPSHYKNLKTFSIMINGKI